MEAKTLSSGFMQNIFVEEANSTGRRPCYNTSRYMDCLSEAKHLKRMLLRIYQCKEDFELHVIDKRPKTVAGCYIVGKKKIRVYAGGRNRTELEIIAIHEYAHHIHVTEMRMNPDRWQERCHGPEFKRIYSKLCHNAVMLGYFPIILLPTSLN